MKLMSNDALWITSGASAMNSRNSSTTWANSGLSARNSLESPCTAKASAGMSRSGLRWPMKGLAGRHAVEDLDTADFNQPVAPQGVEAGGFGIEDDFAHELTDR